ncbi:unnamed protein product [Rotaria magnacalcarata]|uniref:Uncharacterized protein n=1 Tax=Rotaria magnacalcarata TaxID=392030 RepID=A0A819FDA6_9BILA|nr:unnamed protein product [Rotaria magnacalcarata]
MLSTAPKHRPDRGARRFSKPLAYSYHLAYINLSCFILNCWLIYRKIILIVVLVILVNHYRNIERENKTANINTTGNNTAATSTKTNTAATSTKTNTAATSTKTNTAATSTKTNTAATSTKTNTAATSTSTNTTATSTKTNTTAQGVLREISTDNVDNLQDVTMEEQTPQFQLSKSENAAYVKDVNRLRTIIKPKGKSSQNASICEIHALVKSTFKIRRRALSQDEGTEFTLKILRHQEIFHEDALIFEYSLMKNQLFSYDEIQRGCRNILDDFVQQYSIVNQHHMSENDFQAVNKLCEDRHQQHLFFKYGLTGVHPVIGILIMPSATGTFEKAFLFVKNVPYKIPVSIGAGGLHKLLSLMIIVYLNVNHRPMQQLLSMVMEKCKSKKMNDT